MDARIQKKKGKKYTTETIKLQTRTASYVEPGTMSQTVAHSLESVLEKTGLPSTLVIPWLEREASYRGLTLGELDLQKLRFVLSDILLDIALIQNQSHY